MKSGVVKAMTCVRGGEASEKGKEAARGGPGNKLIYRGIDQCRSG